MHPVAITGMGPLVKGAKENKTEQNMAKLVNAEHVQKTWKIRKAYRFVVQGTLQRTQHRI